MASVLAASEKIVDLVCGLAPNGIAEAELLCRIAELDPVLLNPVRLNATASVNSADSIVCWRTRVLFSVAVRCFAHLQL